MLSRPRQPPACAGRSPSGWRRCSGSGWATSVWTARCPRLSRGEAQRVRLALTLISRLEDMLHVLDEPTVGQHPADIQRLLPAFRELAGPVVFVEHERTAAAGADRAIELGPGAGHLGGRVVFSGTPEQLWQADTATGQYFSQRKDVLRPEKRPAAGALPHHPGRKPAQPARYRRAHPARAADASSPASPAPARARWWKMCWCQPGEPQAERLPGHRWAADPPGPGGPISHRAQPALQPGHLHQAERHHPRPVRRRHRAAGVVFFVQPARGRLPHLRRAGGSRSEHALPALHLDPLRRVRRAALHRCGAGSQAPGWDEAIFHCRFL